MTNRKPDQHQIEQPLGRRRYGIFFCGVAALIIGGAALVLMKPPTNTLALADTSGSEMAQTIEPNVWKGAIDPTAIPLGDGKISTSPRVGYVFSCNTHFRGGGARHAGSWINTANNTWDSKTKVAVDGNVYWPSADYTETISGDNRILTTNDLPEKYATGIFPISPGDPAYQYDTNPNAIGSQKLSYTLPLNPQPANQPSCLPMGPIGIFKNGVVLFNALDDAGHDAVAHETQDLNNGHPNHQEMYHYHNLPAGMLEKVTGPSTLVGYALDGYGIYVERDSKGNLPTDADLDACHGRTSRVMWNGKLTDMYHYSVTMEYPYTLGCFHGTPVVYPHEERQPFPPGRRPPPRR
jgi:hypothetical protein